MIFPWLSGRFAAAWRKLLILALACLLAANRTVVGAVAPPDTPQQRKSAWGVFLAARDNIVAQCVYRDQRKPEDVVWGALDALAKDLGPTYKPCFPVERNGPVGVAEEALMLTLLKLDLERGIPFKSLVSKALRAYCRTIDRYSDYDDYETWATVLRAGKFQFVGIGVTLVDRNVEGFILNPFPDGPADRAGVIGGDTLLEVDKKSVRGLSKEDLVVLFTNRAGTRVTLKLRHRDGVVETVDVYREKVDSSPLVITHPPTGLQVACRKITDQAVGDFRVLLRGARPGENLTLDLRGCEGGSITAAVNLASLFLPADSVIGTLETVNGKEQLISSNKFPFAPAKLTILQDRFTASAAELVIVALASNRKLKVETRGERTYGKGVTIMEVSIYGKDSDAVAGMLSITDSRMYGPNNEVWDGEGLPPTVDKK